MMKGNIANFVLYFKSNLQPTISSYPTIFHIFQIQAQRQTQKPSKEEDKEVDIDEDSTVDKETFEY